MNLHWTFEIHVLVKSRVISNDEIKVASTGCEGMPKVSIRTEDGAWTKKEEKEKEKKKKKVLFHSLGVSHSQSLLSVSLCFRSFKSSPQRCTIACLYSQDSGMWSGKLDWSSSVSSPKRLIGERMSCNQREERWRVKNEENRTTKWDLWDTKENVAGLELWRSWSLMKRHGVRYHQRQKTNREGSRQDPSPPSRSHRISLVIWVEPPKCCVWHGR